MKKLTVYSGTIHGNSLVDAKNQHFQALSREISGDKIIKVNSVLLILAALFIFGYVLMSNFLASEKYVQNARRLEFNQLSAILAAQDKENSDTQNLKTLTEFAQKSGLVEAKDAGTIWADSNFALSDTNY